MYLEAVCSLREDIDFAILKCKNVAQLFKDLGEIDKEATQEFAILRYLKYSHSMHLLLEIFKLALDLSTPLNRVLKRPDRRFLEWTKT